VQTVQQLLTEHSCRVALLSLPQDRHLAEEIRLAAPQALVFPSRSIDDVVALVAIADLVITPDTSVVHISAAFDVPCIAMYHSLWWNMHKFAPRSSRSWLVHSIAPSDAVQDVPVEQVGQCVYQWSVQQK
jgi:ADP-heptose:LPS heptosyltransferase